MYSHPVWYQINLACFCSWENTWYFLYSILVYMYQFGTGNQTVYRTTFRYQLVYNMLILNEIRFLGFSFWIKLVSCGIGNIMLNVTHDKLGSWLVQSHLSWQHFLGKTQWFASCTVHLSYICCENWVVKMKKN